MNLKITLLLVALAFSYSSAFASWEYANKKDKMGRGDINMASVQSSNSFNLGFPYKGEQRARLTIMNRPKDGLNILLSIEKGQIMCRSYSPCDLEISFDGEKPIIKKGSGPSDGDSTLVFITGSEKLLEQIKKSKKVAIEIEIYRNGNQVFEFETAGLNWTYR